MSLVRHLAEQMRRRLAVLEAELARLDRESAYQEVKRTIDDCLDGLAALQLVGRDNQLPSSELWNAAGHLLCRGWMLNRARTKPRGYAGDYELLACMYENRLCDDPLGRLLDRYFQEQAAPQAVRNRMQMVSDWIVEQSQEAGDRGRGKGGSGQGLPPRIRIAVFGSAFGLEIRDALRRLDDAARERLHVTLLDLDPAAVDFAQAQLTGLLSPELLTAISTNLFRLPDRPKVAAELAGTDWLFCPGLFDYLDDEAAAIMLRCLFDQLAPAGRMTIFQFAPHNPSRGYMEWFGNWYLTYRHASDFRRLIETAALADSTVTFGAEPLGTDLFATISRPDKTAAAGQPSEHSGNLAGGR
jgi:extracellular factor (EF) 3-hydroxypalmitic acid methyl ester biosynthesis protein